MEKELAEKVSMLAEEMLEKSLQGVFGEKEQKQIVTKAIKNIKKKLTMTNKQIKQLA